MSDIATRTIKHNGKTYQSGDALPDMPAAQRQALIDAGALEQRPDPEPPEGKDKDKSKGKGGK